MNQQSFERRSQLAADRGHPRIVLIVDDDQGTREMFDFAVSRIGLATRVAGSGAEAIAIARSTRADLLLIDLRLPDMLGTHVVRELRNDVAALRFILVSAFLTTALTVEAMKLGAADVIDKPV